MNSPQTNSKSSAKELEYVKQQQQLRAFGKSGNTIKPLSAESMIEDLLSKKETFQKYQSESKPQQEMDMLGWIASGVPQMYERVWSGVQSQLSAGLADTPLLSTLLMSSGLSTDTLGYIWSLANCTVPGALTQSELYIVLALVGLAQTGYVVNNLAALNQLPQAPTPVLDLNLLPTQVALPHVYPSPLNVTNLPDPLAFSWVPEETAHSNSSDKIGISYVSSEPMVSPTLLTDQINKVSNLKSSGGNFKDKKNGKKSLSPNYSQINVDIDTKTRVHVKHSTNTFSFSFPKLNDSPSHTLSTKLEDNFDDEFTDFQSADFTSLVMSSNDKDNSKYVNFAEEFTNFEKALPKPDDDNLSVLVIGGKNNPSSQQLWIAENLGQEICNSSRAGENLVSNQIPDRTLEDNPELLLMKHLTHLDKKDDSLNKYDVFQEMCDDEYSVFHNPLPDDEGKQYTNVSGIASDTIPPETKLIFQHSLIEDKESPINLFSINHPPIIDHPELKNNNQSNDVKDDNDDEEFANFQTFSATDLDIANAEPEEKNDKYEDIDKYDVFRTIVFQDSASEEGMLHLSRTNKSKEENISDISSIKSEADILNNSGQNGVKFNLSNSIMENQNAKKMSFTEFQIAESNNIILSSSLNIDGLFSSLAISENEEDKESKEVTHIYPSEDKYKALRLLEIETNETDDFGEFSGAKLPNSGNGPSNGTKQISIQVRCLEACLNLLRTGLSTFSTASSPEVISELLSYTKANVYLDCLLEVHRVSERIIRHMNSESCVSIMAELHEIWDRLAPYFSYADHNHMTETVGSVCGVCRSDTGPSPVSFGAQTFHTPCANLYLHCVEHVLPNIAVASVQ